MSRGTRLRGTKTGLFPLLLSLVATVAVGTDGGSKTPVYLEGSFTFEVLGPGAAPYGITSGLLGSLGIGVNLGRMANLLQPVNPGLDADEHTRIDIDFRLAPASRERWKLFEYSVHHTAEDHTTFQEDDVRIADSMISTDEARFTDGRWSVAPDGIPADFEPRIDLRTWRAETAAACEQGPGWLPAFLARDGEVLCYELELDLVYPVAPRGTSEWITGDEFGVRLRAENGVYRFSVEAPEIPDISGMLPDREQSIVAMQTLAEFFSELTGRATGSKAQAPSIDPSGVEDVRKNASDLLEAAEAMRDQINRLEIDLRGAHSLQRTWRGAAENGLIRIDDVYPILSGGEASDLGRLPILYPYLEKVDEDWLPESDNRVKVAAGIEGGASEPMDWRFELRDVTTERGECLNSEKRDRQPDLQFDDDINVALGLTSAQKIGEAWRVETAEPQERVTLWVAARDYGAWGTLRAWIKMGDDWQPVAVEGSDVDHITIPLDEAGGENFIADAWERSEGIAPGQDHRIDDDENGPKNIHRGDGLSLFEEYRGVLVKGDHFRTHPTVKDLFIHIQPGSGLDGFGNYFGEAAGTAVHELSRGEFFGPGDTGVINRNSSQDKRWTPSHRQGGKYVEVLPKLRGGDVCGLAWIGGHQANIADTPYCKTDETFVHELMHSLWVNHHGWDLRPALDACYELSEDGSIEYYFDAHCSDHPEGNPTKVSIAFWDSPYCGDQFCFMAYLTATGFMESRSHQRPVLNADGSLKKFESPGYRGWICKTQDGTEYNANGQQVNGASREYGNCWDQIRIRDED